MNAPKKTMTASGPANGTPSRTRYTRSVAASVIAVSAVDRR